MVEFTKLEDGRIKWEEIKEETNFENDVFGKLGVKGGHTYIIFDDFEKAKAVLDNDIIELEKHLEQYEQDMKKNEHNLDKFTDLKELLNNVAELNINIKNIDNSNAIKLYYENPKKYQKLISEFNKAKQTLGNEMAVLSQEYKKYQNYKIAQNNYEFAKKEYEKVQSRLENLNKLI